MRSGLVVRLFWFCKQHLELRSLHRGCLGLLVLTTCMFAASSAYGEEKAQLLIADMETKVDWKSFPPEESKLERVQTTASQGKYSLRFQAPAMTRASVAFKLDKSLEGLDVLEFDFYCERQNGARLYVNLHPVGDADKEKNLTIYTAKIDPKIGRDGWTTIRLVRDRSLRKRVMDRNENWNNPRALSFSLSGDGQGEFVCYIDNIRFSPRGEEADHNLMFNSSFEITTNPDIPDGWRGDIGVPPFGPEYWGLDSKDPWHGEKSLRMGKAGKIARAWGGNVSLTVGQPYTFSAYLKADQPGRKATITMNGLNRPNSIEVEVTDTWQRYELSGTAFRARTSLSIAQESDGVLWIDGVQVEENSVATEYQWPKHDQLEIKKIAGGEVGNPEPLNNPGRSTQIVFAKESPKIDGKLDDAIWQTEPGMKDFVQLKQDSLATPKTRAWAAYDNEALYVAVEAQDPNPAALRSRMQGTKAAWSADGIEVFLDTNVDRQSFYQFVINPNGQVYAVRYNTQGRHAQWTGQWQGQASIGENGWTAEVRIPYTALDLSKPFAKSLGLNVARTYKPSAAARSAEYTSWSFSHSKFRNPRAFGVANGFDPAVLDPYRIDVLGLTWANGQAKARLHNQTKKAVELSGHFVLDQNNETKSEAFTVSLAPDGVQDVQLDMPIAGDGNYAIRMVAKDVKGRRIESPSAAITVADSAEFEIAGVQYDRYLPSETARFRAVYRGKITASQPSSIQWKVGSQSGKHKLTAGLNEWDIPLAGLKVGHHTVTVQFIGDGNTSTEMTTPLRIVPQSERMTRINRWGQFLQLNGQAFFPYGFFTEAVSRQISLEEWREILVDLKKNNCNSVLAYTGMRTGLSERLKAYLDIADEEGIKMWVDISGYFIWHIAKVQRQTNRYKDQETANADLRKLMETVRNHPALLGWAAFDEPGNRPDELTGTHVIKSANLVRELDPHRPFFCTHLNHMGDTDIYGPGTDLGMMPFLASGGRYDNMFRELHGAGLPVMINTPVYGASGNAVREPTVDEVRVRVWKGVVMGASGVEFYLYRPYSQIVWKALGDMNVQIQSILPGLLADRPVSSMLVTPASSELQTSLRFDGTHHYLFAVNTSPVPMQVAFDLLGLKRINSIEPLIESPALKNASGTPRLNILIPSGSVVAYKLDGVILNEGSNP